MNPDIVKAIDQMRLLSFSYDGFPRIVEPHAYGVTTAGNEAIRCYQVSGESSSGKVPGWHLMTISKIIGLSVLSDSFARPRPEYKKGDKGLATIYCEL